MKKSVCLKSVIIISLAFFSCSNSKDLTDVSENLYTIKNIVTHIEDETVWATELEQSRLSKPVAESAAYIPEGHSLTTDSARLSSALRPSVYPSFSDFGSLDVSSVEYKYLEGAEKLCSNISLWKEELLFNIFPASFRFNFIFFAEELKAGWKNNFSADFPEAEIVVTGEGDGKIEESVIHLFDRWIFGEPAILENLIQFPVRFYCNLGYVDVTLYMSPERENSLYNIKIERWVKHE